MNAKLPNNEKARVAKLRRMAENHDLVLCKTRDSETFKRGYAGWYLMHRYHNIVVHGSHPVVGSLSLDDVEAALAALEKPGAAVQKQEIA